jgi:hypothetical protein
MADQMGLRDWTICVSGDEVDGEPHDAESEIGADCTVTYGRKNANIRFSNDWSNWEPADLRYVVVHELVHCHTIPIEWALNHIQTHLSFAMMQMVRDAHTDFHELAVDGIAGAWAETLPLPIRVEPLQEAA